MSLSDRTFYRITPEIPVFDGEYRKPGFMPGATVMVSTLDKDGNANIIPLLSVVWLSNFPLQFGIGVCNGTYNWAYYPRKSHQMLKDTMDFVLNIPHTGLVDEITKCGELSGTDPNKFEAAGLTQGQSKIIKSPYIVECPVNYEIKIEYIINFGSHDLFAGPVVGVHMIGKDTPPLSEIQESLNIMHIDGGDDGKWCLEWSSLPALKRVE